MIVGSWSAWIPYSLTETLGFVTGASCVYLVVREHVWNFPIGVASAAIYLVVFWQARLFGDAGLQLVFIALGLQGWYWWLRGGENRTVLRVTRASPALWAGLIVFTGVATYGLMVILTLVKGSAPFLDAFTTALSLAAQYLVNAKKIENWLLWIVADSLYVYLYIVRGLQLTAILYAVFLIMAVAGLIEWRKSLNQSPQKQEFEPTAHPGPAEVV